MVRTQRCITNSSRMTRLRFNLPTFEKIGSQYTVAEKGPETHLQQKKKIIKQGMQKAIEKRLYYVFNPDSENSKWFILSANSHP